MAVYNDFSIEISATPSGYTVRARASAGQAQAETSLPLSSLELENRLQAVELSLLRGRGGLRRALSENERQAQELGQILFDFLLSGPVRALFDLSRLESERGERGLRLLLTVKPPELAALPWELLFHSREGEFLALSQSTPVVRYWAAPYAQQALTVTPPLRVLGVVAGPADWEDLDVAQEKQRLEEALAPLQQSGLAELVWLDGQSRRDLQSAMRSGPWHAIHFIGHGGFDKERDEGFIVLCNEVGQAAPLYAVELARLVADHPSLRLVFLNACEGATASQGDDLASSAAALVRRSVPAVVAMQYPISDSAAIEFARTFYEGLADNLSVDAAVTDARKAVSFSAPHSPEWATPVLFLAAADGRLFALEKAVDAAPPPDTSTPRDGPRAAPPGGTSGFRPYLWLPILLVILALALWQFWPWDQSEGGPTPRPTQTTAAVVPIPSPQTTPSPPAATAGSNGPSDVRLHITFDDLASILQPAIGAGGFTNLTEENFVPGRVQSGLWIQDRGQVVRFPMLVGDAPLFSLEKGEAELWYRPDYDFLDNLPARNEHTLFVVGDIYNPPHLLLTMSERLRIEYLADWDHLYFAESESPALPWTKGDWLHIRAAWDRSSPDDAFQLHVNDLRVDVTRTGGGWPLPDVSQMESQMGSHLGALFVGSGNATGDLEANGLLDELIVRDGAATKPVAAATATAIPTPVSGWARLGESGPEIDGWVNALAVTDESVYVGGTFKSPSPGLLTWNRRADEWGTLGSGVTGTVQSLLVDGADVYIGGDFTVEGADGETIRGLARWDGEAWHPIGDGLFGLNRGPVAGVAALALDAEKNLYVGGIFTGAGNGDGTGVSARGILRWNRALAQWQRLGGDEDASGLVRFSGDSQPVFVAAMEMVGEYLYVGGHFAAIADRNGGSFPNSRNFARWHIPSEQWEGVGRVGSNSEPVVYAIATDGDDIYVGGDFDTVYDEAGTPINAVLLARWNQTSQEWGGICCINDKDSGRTLANGLTSYGTIGVVRGLAVGEKGLYVAGRFNEAGDQATNNVARYRNGSWARLTMRSPTLGTVAGVNDTIFALALAGDEVIVGGKFTGFGEVTNGSGLARWGE